MPCFTVLIGTHVPKICSIIYGIFIIAKCIYITLVITNNKSSYCFTLLFVYGSRVWVFLKKRAYKIRRIIIIIDYFQIIVALYSPVSILVQKKLARLAHKVKSIFIRGIVISTVRNILFQLTVVSPLIHIFYQLVMTLKIVNRFMEKTSLYMLRIFPFISSPFYRSCNDATYI